MKTITYKIIVFFLMIYNCSIFAQYHGGNSDGAAFETVSNTTCSIPPSFFPYFGGNSDAAAVETLENTTCPFSNHFYAYFGGNADAAAVETLENTVCGFPPQFFTYFGGENDGSALETTASICSTLPPIANFTSSATAICVGQSVTFTDTSANQPSAWTWTFTGGTPATSSVQNPVVTYNTPGTYTVKLVAANFNGTNTKTITNYITVSNYPNIAATNPGARCDPGTVLISANASVGIVNWYADATGGTILATGGAFTTPVISTTTTFYAEAVNGGCSSPRTPVVATINTTPTVTTTTPATRCGTGSVTLNATSSAGGVIWYGSLTSNTGLANTNNFVTPSLSTTTTYYVQAVNGTCSSPRIPVIATIQPSPTVTSTVPGSRCGSGTVILEATASSGTLNWYSATSGGILLGTGATFTSPSITTSTYYYVEATNGSCSSARTTVLAKINAVPAISGTTPASRCGTGSVTLFASASNGNVVWYDAATGGNLLSTSTSFSTPNISTTTSYFVEAVNGSCTSATRTEVIATINPSPTITSTTPTTICGGTFTISATASAGTLAWYNVPTGGIVQGTGNNFSLSNWPQTTTFYVQATNGSCQSPRVPVVVTVIGKPFNTALYPANRCGAGTLTLGAQYTIGTAQWFTVPSGGTAVASGPTFTTSNISTTTTYYVEGLNNGCTSEIRTAITATINNTAAPTGNASQTFCPGSYISDILATGNNIIWYDAPAGGNVLQTSTLLADGVTYYASQTLSGCEGASRLAVTVNFGSCLSTDENIVKDIRFYPNPVQNTLFITSPTKVERIIVYDMSGKVIFSGKFNNKEIQIDFAQYATATYLVKVFSENSSPKIFKIIKK